ncbi:TAXI family TRAP transporter solute-binding subunit [Natrinema caseinilyticum]|uniref:TAXI family TRAP transporter solute-binding subunit n=1 Tax=Natrinema caseinilyticum TaxID=2961570 RepID=UPI0020C33BF4|nr:TAXI family TRAP transporter solute-binding subunit [Natrinema caseinilyticum]
MVDDRNRMHTFTNRRAFLAAGVGTTAAMAGCLNSLDEGLGEGSDGSNLTIVTAASETGTYAASQGIAATVDEHAEQITVEAQPSEGTEDNIGRLGRGEADIGMIQHRSAQKILNGDEPYGGLEYTPQQIFHYNDLPWLFVTNNDWTSLADVESGARISPTPGESGTRETLSEALEIVVDDYEQISVGYGEQAGAMQEGQLDVGAITISNFDFEASWIQEMKQTVDTRILEWPDSAVSELENKQGIPIEPIDMTKFDGYAHAPGEAIGINIPYNFVVRGDLEYDYVYDFLETMHEHREEMKEDHPYLGYYMDDEWWTTRMYDEFPFHPAAADFYEEIGVWSDEYVRGDE